MVASAYARHTHGYLINSPVEAWESKLMKIPPFFFFLRPATSAFDAGVAAGVGRREHQIDDAQELQLRRGPRR